MWTPWFFYLFFVLYCWLLSGYCCCCRLLDPSDASLSIEQWFAFQHTATFTHTRTSHHNKYISFSHSSASSNRYMFLSWIDSMISRNSWWQWNSTIYFRFFVVVFSHRCRCYWLCVSFHQLWVGGGFLCVCEAIEFLQCHEWISDIDVFLIFEVLFCWPSVYISARITTWTQWTEVEKEEKPQKWIKINWISWRRNCTYQQSEKTTT